MENSLTVAYIAATPRINVLRVQDDFEHVSGTVPEYLPTPQEERKENQLLLCEEIDYHFQKITKILERAWLLANNEIKDTEGQDFNKILLFSAMAQAEKLATKAQAEIKVGLDLFEDRHIETLMCEFCENPNVVLDSDYLQ